MRRSVLIVCLLSSIALAQNAPAPSKPKGRLVNPFGHIPRSRGPVRLPDPRTAAEKAAADGVVSPDAPPPTASPAPPTLAPAPPPSTPVPASPGAPSSAAPTSAPASTAASTGASAPSPASSAASSPSQIAAPAAAGTFPAFRRSKTPFGVTTMRIKMEHDDTPPTPPRHGGTLQAGLGPGWIHLSSDDIRLKSPRATAGLSLGYGVWVNENVAMSLRAGAVAIPYSNGTLTQGFIGPALQIWPTKATWWFGFGLGIGTLDIDYDGSGGARTWGIGGNLRVGHTLLERSGHALDLSLEVSPAAFELDGYGGDDMSLVGTSFGLLVGYQML